MRRFLALLLLLASAADADVAVIVHVKNTVAAPGPREVQDIFLGRTRTFPDGRLAVALDQPSPLRDAFYQTLTQRPVEQINAYWARLLFTGQASPPTRLPDDDAVLKTVRENEGAIGYVDAARVDKTVRLLFLLKP
jgi:ABC-type phosphate transport system substrate-binding protein